MATEVRAQMDVPNIHMYMRAKSRLVSESLQNTEQFVHQFDLRISCHDKNKLATLH